MIYIGFPGFFEDIHVFFPYLVVWGCYVFIFVHLEALNLGTLSSFTVRCHVSLGFDLGKVTTVHG